MRKIKIDVLNNKITLGNNNEPNNSMLIHVVELDSFTTELELDFTGLNVDEYIKAVDFETSDGIKTQYRIGNGVIVTMPLDSFLTKGGLLKIQPFALNEETGRRLGGFIYEVNIIHSINTFDQGNLEEFPDFGKLLQDQIDEINIEVVNINGRLDLKADKSYVDDAIDYINYLLGLKLDKTTFDSYTQWINNELNVLQQEIDGKANNEDLLSLIIETEQLRDQLNTKADKSNTYTKVEVDNIANSLEVDLSDYYDKGEVDALIENVEVGLTDYYDKDETDALLNTKADKLDTYTKTEVDNSLGLKANKSDTYTKTEVDTKLSEKVQNFKLKNEIVNGDFSDGTNGWTIAQDTTVDIPNNEVTIIGTSTLSRITQQLTNKQTGIYYIHTLCKTSDTGIRLTLYSIEDDMSSFYYDGSGEWQRVSGIKNITGLNNFQFQLQRAIGTSIWKEITLLNLTQIFGAGNEPTKEEMDEIINIIGWFDNEYAVSNKEMFIALLNMIRKNTMAIIALGGTQ